MSPPQLVEVNRYRFSADALTEIQADAYAANNWPLVYVISDGAITFANHRLQVFQRETDPAPF